MRVVRVVFLGLKMIIASKICLVKQDRNKSCILKCVHDCCIWDSYILKQQKKLKTNITQVNENLNKCQKLLKNSHSVQ